MEETATFKGEGLWELRERSETKATAIGVGWCPEGDRVIGGVFALIFECGW